jgi:transglutaminase-like putative cysteine protease
MRLEIEAGLVYEFAGSTQVLISIQASQSRDQDILSESLVFDPDAPLTLDRTLEGDRQLRCVLSGPAQITYRAAIENRMRPLLPAQGRQHSWDELPHFTFPFLLPSRFCPSDRFMRFAQREFPQQGDGVARVLAVLDWIHRHIDYLHGVSDAETTALETFVDRAGVCRDFTHLAITFCRAIGVPARAVSAYALDLQPPDFHAVLEVYLENAWWLVDPTRLAPVGGLVRIGSGRDASDIAFMTTDKPCRMIEQNIVVRAVDQAADNPQN